MARSFIRDALSEPASAQKTLLKFYNWPVFGFAQHLLVFKNVGDVAVASQPVRYFLPTPRGTTTQPGIIRFVEPGANPAQTSGEAIIALNSGYRAGHPAGYMSLTGSLMKLSGISGARW